MSADDRTGPLDPDEILAQAEEVEFWGELAPDDRHSLVDLINRVLDRGVVIKGDITISVAGVDLVYLGLNALLTSVSTARRVIDARIGPPGPRDAGGGG